MSLLLPRSTLFPYTTLFRSAVADPSARGAGAGGRRHRSHFRRGGEAADRACLPGPEASERQRARVPARRRTARSEEHTSELQSHSDLVCRLLLEKKKRK